MTTKILRKISQKQDKSCIHPENIFILKYMLPCCYKNEYVPKCCYNFTIYIILFCLALSFILPRIFSICAKYASRKKYVTCSKRFILTFYRNMFYIILYIIMSAPRSSTDGSTASTRSTPPVPTATCRPSASARF